MSHWRSHVCKVSTSCCQKGIQVRLIIDSDIDCRVIYKTLDLVCLFSGTCRSLIYSKNNKGPSTEPCWTPEWTRISDELSPSSTTV